MCQPMQTWLRLSWMLLAQIPWLLSRKVQLSIMLCSLANFVDSIRHQMQRQKIRLKKVILLQHYPTTLMMLIRKVIMQMMQTSMIFRFSRKTRWRLLQHHWVSLSSSYLPWVMRNWNPWLGRMINLTKLSMIISCLPLAIKVWLMMHKTRLI